MAHDTATSLLKESDSFLIKEERKTEDLSKPVDELIAQLKALKPTLVLTNSIFDSLFALDKKCRQAQDSVSGSKLVLAYLLAVCTLQNTTQNDNITTTTTTEDINVEEEDTSINPLDATTIDCIDKPYKPNCTISFLGSGGIHFMCDQISMLIKKRSQLKKTILTVVRFGAILLKYLKLKDKLILIQTLKKVTEGKIFVEVERARVILMEALILEKNGEIDKAAALLMDVQVETCGAMERHEKTRYVLKHMDLLLARGDYIRCQIVSRKINQKLLEAEDMADLKIKYYNLMVFYHLHDSNMLDIAKCYKAVIDTPHIKKDEKLYSENLEAFLIFLVLSPRQKETEEQLRDALKTEAAKFMQQNPVFERLLNDVLKKELMAWPLSYEATYKQHILFGDLKYVGGDARWALLRKRILQHNIDVLSCHYTRITLKRAAYLLKISTEELEIEICEGVCDGRVLAKIDRPAGIIYFGDYEKKKLDVLDTWAKDTSKLIDNVDLCCHMIQKERMVHAARAKASALAISSGN